jgi:hypothetical protein
MKKLTKEEKSAMVTRPLRKQGVFRSYLLQMQVDDIVFISAQEWPSKSATPGYLCRRVEKKTTFKFEVEKVLNAAPGWIVTRTH